MDKLFNFFLNIYNSIARRLIKKNKHFPPKVSYVLVHSDIFIDLHNWIKNLWWGSYAEDEKTSWMDEKCVQNTPSYLVFNTKKDPKINEHTGELMPYSRGSIQRKEPIRNYGAIEVVAKIYPSKGMWHAPLWFVAAGEGSEIKVLPEIDVAEVYTKGNPNKIEAKTNLHYGEDYEENSKKIGAKTHHIPNMNRFVSYGLVWLEDKLEIYYDGWLVRRIKDKSILKRLEKGIIPIINTSVNPNQPFTDGLMEVKSFKVWEL